MGVFEVANRLNILAGRRNIQWLTRLATQPHEQVARVGGGAAYPGVNDGIAFTSIDQSGVLGGAFWAQCREDPAFRTVRINLTNIDLAASYTFTDGTNIGIAIGPFADANALFDAWKSAINTNFAGVLTAGAIDVDGDGQSDELVITGSTTADYGASWSTGGGAAIVGRGDPVSYKLTVVAQPVNTSKSIPAPTGWFLLRGAKEIPVDRFNLSDTFDASGISRAYGLVTSVIGAPLDHASMNYSTPVYITPAQVEG